MNFFYKPGIDITHDREMFEFVHDHFRCSQLVDSMTGQAAIANNLKLDCLGVQNWRVAQAILEQENYMPVYEVLDRWESENPDYFISFYGCSSDYITIAKRGQKSLSISVVPPIFDACESYEEYKQACFWSLGGVKYHRNTLRETVKVLQSFDKLCDELRDMIARLAESCYEIDTMKEAVSSFNQRYVNDLKMLNFSKLRVDADGTVDLSEVIRLQCLTEAFLKFVEKHEQKGYHANFIDATRVKLEARDEH